MAFSWEYLRDTGYRVEVSDMLPWESQQDDGSVMRTDAVVDHRNKVITCSRACLKKLQEALP